jgi:hypothetical protein
MCARAGIHDSGSGRDEVGGNVGAAVIGCASQARRFEEIVTKMETSSRHPQRNAKEQTSLEKKTRGRPKDVDRKMTIHKCIRVLGILAHELKS